MKTLIACACCLACAATAQEAPVLDTPRNGWSHAGLADRSDEARVAYPSPPIDRGAQRHRTLIEGRLRMEGKTMRGRGPALVINGNPLTLQTGADGRFARHYAFGAGSNSVELRDAQGRMVARRQFYEANRSRLAPQVRIACSWDVPEAEIDLHIVTPDGQHAFWARPVLDGGGGLDLDSVDGPGPEMFSTVAPQRGAYHVYVNYWGSYSQAEGYSFDEGRRSLPVVTVRVELVFHENTPDEKRESFVVPMRKIGDLTLVKSFLY